jgi:phage shock protein E
MTKIKKIQQLFVILILSTSSLLSCAQRAQQSEYKNLTVDAFNEKMQTTPDAVVLDVRTEDEVNQGIIPHAVHLDFFGKAFEKKLNALDKNKTYFVYCASGGRSGETLELMQKKGFKTVYNLEGGFTAWQKAKMPVQLTK